MEWSRKRKLTYTMGLVNIGMIDLPGYRPDNTPDNRIEIPKVEFYITNVCNLTCHNCNRYNNHDFKGFQKWSDYKEIYTEWAKKIKIKHIVILGGEPLLNPTIIEWINGLHRLWPVYQSQVITNGTYLNKIPNLYEKTKYQTWFQISIHNTNDIDAHFQNIQKFLTEPIEMFNDKTQVDGQGKSATWGADFLFKDKNNIVVTASIQDDFYNISIHLNENNQLTLHNNNPIEAHQDCGFAKYKNYHFIRGKLYKCGPVALIPEFDRQYPLAISSEDRELLNSYTPLSVADFDQHGREFLANIDNVIPQCKFCPSSFSNTKIYALNKAKDSTSSFKA